MHFKVLFLAIITLFTFLSGSSTLEAASPGENYRFYCAQCHGLKGDGRGINSNETQPVSPRDHTDARAMSKLSDREIISVIKEGGRAVGKSTMMPPFSETLSEKEIIGLKDYMRELCRCTGLQ
jgi:cytochrome c oxidase cbb3-type subunit 3